MEYVGEDLMQIIVNKDRFNKVMDKYFSADFKRQILVELAWAGALTTIDAENNVDKKTIELERVQKVWEAAIKLSKNEELRNYVFDRTKDYSDVSIGDALVKITEFEKKQPADTPNCPNCLFVNDNSAFSPCKSCKDHTNWIYAQPVKVGDKVKTLVTWRPDGVKLFPEGTIATIIKIDYTAMNHPFVLSIEDSLIDHHYARHMFEIIKNNG